MEEKNIKDTIRAKAAEAAEAAAEAAEAQDKVISVLPTRLSVLLPA